MAGSPDEGAAMIRRPLRKTSAVLSVLAVLLATVALLSQPASADSTTFHMRFDTWVDKAAPTTVHGADTTLRMNNDANKTKWTYAKVPAGDMTLPAGATTSKTEIIFRTLESDATQVISVFAQPNCTWAGGDSLTWSNTGALGAIYPPGGLLAASSPAGTTAGVDKVVDVGNYITGNADWCVVLKTSFTNNKQQYRSVRSANGDPALDVRARITYSTTAPTTTTTVVPQAPTVVTDAATNVASSSATLNGTVNPNGQGASYHFEYGPTNGGPYPTSVPVPDGSAGSGTTAVSESEPIAGLAASTPYYYRLVATNATGTTNGAQQSFTTTAAAQQPPTVVTGAASTVTAIAATLNGTVNPNGQATTYHFEYGPTTSYGTNIPVPDGSAGSGSTAVSESAAVRQLLPSTTYHYRLVATNGAGTTNGADGSFTTNACSAPITITAPGVYTGCWRSTSTSTNAVTVNTPDQVEIVASRIEHTGRGIRDGAASQEDLNVHDTVFQALDPGGTLTAQRAVEMFAPGSMVLEHNLLLDGAGFYAVGPVGGQATVNPLRVRYNVAQNIAKYNQSGFVQFLQLNKITAAGGEVAWNKVTNVFGQSGVEDNVNLYESLGTVASPLDLHHNLLDGAYPRTATAGYSGGGIIAGDGGSFGSSYVQIRDNTAISTTNYGVAIYGGHDNHLLRNTTVSDGRAADGTYMTAANVGVYVWNANAEPAYARNDAKENTSGWINTPTGGRNDYWFPNCDPASACTINDAGDPSTNHTMSGTVDAADEQAARDAWEAARVAAGVTVGPQP